MYEKTKVDPVKVSALKQISLNFKGVDRASQRECLRTAFQAYPLLDTVEIRDFLGILHPAGRVMELREGGFNIITLWTTVESENGSKHRIAQYLWLPREMIEAEASDHA